MTKKEYAFQLVEKHGPDKALRMMQKYLDISHRSSSSYLFDDADWSLNNNGTYEFSKTQSKKVTNKHTKRVKSNVNFYTEILNIIRKDYAKN